MHGQSASPCILNGKLLQMHGKISDFLAESCPSTFVLQVQIHASINSSTCSASFCGWHHGTRSQHPQPTTCYESATYASCCDKLPKSRASLCPCEDITQTHAETHMRDAHADTHRQNPRSSVLLISLRTSSRTRLSFLASTCSTVLAFCLGPNRFGANRTVFNGAL